MTIPDLDTLRAGGKPALAQCLAAIETHTADPALTALLDQAWSDPKGHVLGITGPPGVGKSSLINRLIARWRREDLSVGVIAVDPSSRRSGGALLGDRTRIVTDPEDQQIFVRSMAARDRLGGLAALTFPAMVCMRAVFDRIIVETVGIGQSETDIADLADSVAFCVQPGSGDSLQFMKAGIMEIPDLVLVTKADMGPIAIRARADVEGALSLAASSTDGWSVPVLTLSALSGEGLDTVLKTVEDHRRWLDIEGRLDRRRHTQGRIWLENAVRDRFGREGLKRAKALGNPSLSPAPGVSPFSLEADFARALLKGWPSA